ncbi:MAG TPA: nucleoside phosphorylase [Spirochaetales bacterium]|nr:nucleoside phosphorylase [Spirochaetales bacterium]
MSIPLSKAKYASRAVFSPRDFIDYARRSGFLGDAPAPAAAILCYQRSLFDYVRANHAVEAHPDYFGSNLQYLLDSGRSVALVGRFGVGAPAAAVMLEELAAWGVERFVSIGTAGALVEGLEIGSIVVCEGAFRDEGVSYHYLPAGDRAYPCEKGTRALEAAFDAAGLPWRRCVSWTTDAIYRETPADLAELRARGATVAEMEAAALFAVARYRGARIASCFTVSDIVADDEWHPEFHSEETHGGLEALFKASLAALSAPW